jgi:hypothetical protein
MDLYVASAGGPLERDVVRPAAAPTLPLASKNLRLRRNATALGLIRRFASTSSMPSRAPA